MDLCVCVNEYHRDGEGVVLQESSLLSYIRKYIISLTEGLIQRLGDLFVYYNGENER